MAFDIEFVRQIRLQEIAQALRYMQPGQQVLEIGAGAGWQSEVMMRHGLHVIAVDLPDTAYASYTVCPIIQYDGKHLPLAAHSMDVIFSSNVLEHVRHIEAFLVELRRVLRPDGRAIHMMPTPAWRWWTSLSHCGITGGRFYRKLRRYFTPSSGSSLTRSNAPEPIRSAPGLLPRVQAALWSGRHGEFGNAVTELYYFSHWRWQSLFERTGWCVERIEPNDLFYSGNSLCGPRIGFAARHRLSKVMGSACMMYIVHPV
jgi:SAM-dependent methyltransferase